MSRVQQAVVLDLRTSNILISILPTIDQLSCHERLIIKDLIISKAIKEYKDKHKEYREVHRKYPSSAKSRDGECSSPGTAVHASSESK